MSQTRTESIRSELPAVFMVVVGIGVLMAMLPGIARGAQGATPSASSCGEMMGAMSTPMMGHSDMMAATPEMGGMTMPDEEVAFDLAYIDMMVPHHESIIALAQVALPELTDPRLVEMAENIIASQSGEIDTLLDYREAWYGDAPPVSMGAMMEAIPSMMSMPMDSMMQLMSPERLVSTFCASENPDLAFIELTIPHHQMAIDASEDAIEKAEHPELVEIATEVIEAQQAEIDMLNLVEAELTGDATPEG